MKPSLLPLLPLILSCVAARAADPATAAVANRTNLFAIRGMHCDGCASGIRFELLQTPGVAAADVSLTNRTAVVAYDTNRVSARKLVQVVKEAGFTARVK